MTERSRTDRASSVVFMVCAAAMALAVVYRTFRPAQAVSATTRQPAAVSEAIWQNALGAGIFIGGSREGPVTIVELTDLECPACRGFESTLDDVLVERPTDVRLLYVPHPLSYHRFAMAAAKGAECAADVGSLPRWIKTVYAGQDSLGLKSWGAYAADARISDTALIARCAREARPSPRVQNGLALGSSLGSVGTPTVIVNGLRFFDTPTKDQLEKVIDSAGRSAPRIAERLTLLGRVLDSATSAPVASATVALLTAAGEVIAHDESTADGGFGVRTANGRYRIRVTRVGYDTFVASRLTELRGVLPPHVILLSQTTR